jgi:hypothetical protein
LNEGDEEKRRMGGSSRTLKGGKPSLRDTIFGEDSRDRPSGEDVEYQRHASVKLTSFLDQVIVVVEGWPFSVLQ